MRGCGLAAVTLSILLALAAAPPPNVQILIQSQEDTNETTPPSLDPVTLSSEGHDPVTSSYEGHDPVTSTSEGHNPVTSSSEGHDTVTSSPEGNDPVTSSPEGNDTMTSSSEGHDPVTSIFEGQEDLNRGSENAIQLDMICGLDDRYAKAKRIVNGTRILKPHHWPWQASFYANTVNISGYIFGGAVIGRQWILTTAHTFKMMPPELLLGLTSTWEVRVGEEQQGVLGPTVQRRSVTHIYVHPEYVTREKPHDIALVKLETPLHFGPQVQPLCLPPPLEVVDHLGHCIVSGYPTQGDTGSHYHDIKLPLWTHERCSLPEFQGPAVIPSMLCAGHEAGGSDACRGDSGRPLMCLIPGRRRWTATGLVSWGQGCGIPRKPGVYTRVRAYLPWIRGHVFGGPRP